MNSASWHLAINHFPIVGTIFSTLLLAGGIILKNNHVRNAGLVFYILTALLAIPALLTGEGAEEVLESIGQENEHFIHDHEEHAEQTFWVCQGVAVLSLIVLLGEIIWRKNLRIVVTVVLLSGLLCSYLMYETGNSGGEIRHTEIRKTNADGGVINSDDD